MRRLDFLLRILVAGDAFSILCRLPKLGNLPQPFGETEVYRQGSAKRGSIHTDGFKDILEEFPAAFDGVKPLCRELRSILFPLTRDGELDLATPAYPNTLYNSIIKAFERSIVRLNRGT
jgi:hypothetical protein